MIYVAIVGPGDSASVRDTAHAHSVGALCAARGWITLTGGRNCGVMAAAAEGASSVGGTSIGILPGSDRSDAADALTASLPTGLGEARNAVLVSAADGVIACGLSAGTLSEMALAVAGRRPLALVQPGDAEMALLSSIAPGLVWIASSAEDAVEWMARQLVTSAGPDQRPRHRADS